MLRIVLLGLLICSTAVVVAVAPALGGSAGKQAFPDLIQLPTGFRPKGIEIGKGASFYVGSVANDRSIVAASARETILVVPGSAGVSATGIELDKFNRLFVAGGGTGSAYVYDAGSGDLIRSYQLASAPTFINDVVVTRDAAYFTDSSNPVLYRIPIAGGGGLGEVQKIDLGGDYTHVADAFNLNGIDATANGKQLIAVQSVNGRLYRIDPATGEATGIQLANGESVLNGDGILLAGKTLYVVQNRDNAVAVIGLSADLGSGEVQTRLGDPDFDVPTTIDDHGSRLYAVNARFGIGSPDSVSYQVVHVG